MTWVIVPLLAQRDGAAGNEPLQGTGLVNGYGAGKVLGWLVSGQLLDHGRLPVITALADVGLLAIVRCRRNPGSRALLALCLALSFGRATVGALVELLPDYGGYPPLLALAAVTLLTIAAGERLARRAGKRSRQRVPASSPP